MGNDDGRAPHKAAPVSALRLIGPTVEDDIRRAILTYGKEAVKTAVKKLTASKRGRPPEADWITLRPMVEEDAVLWLDGEDPFIRRTNYAMAKAIADQGAIHNHPATMERIERKLAKKPYDRRHHTITVAVSIARQSRPFSQYLNALKALMQIDKSAVWPMLHETALKNISDYEQKVGSAPDPLFTIEELETAIRNALMAYVVPKARTGLFGGTSQPSALGLLGGSISPDSE